MDFSLDCLTVYILVMLLFKSWYGRHQCDAVKQSRRWELIVATILKILLSIYR